ncbi:hypothetical protein MTO96_002817 [Rhipicephalus appendiculatus]
MEPPKDVLPAPASTTTGDSRALRALSSDRGTVHRGSRSYSIHSFSRRLSRDPLAPDKWPSIERFQVEEQQMYGLAGLLMPLYLSPLIYQGTRESLCMYSMLLPLCWWATGSIPRCMAALAPMVTLPVLQTMSADEAAAAFLTPASLIIFIFLVIVTAGRTSGSMDPQAELQDMQQVWRPVAVTYVTSLFVPKTVVAVLLNLVVDKILRCIHHCERDRTLIEHHDSREESDKQPPLAPTRQCSLASIKPDDLLAELAEAVVQLARECAFCKKTHKGPCLSPEPQREKWEIEEPPLPAPPPAGRQATVGLPVAPVLTYGRGRDTSSVAPHTRDESASRRQRSDENFRAGGGLSPQSPGTFSPQSTLTELRRNSMNLNRYQIKKEAMSKSDRKVASPTPLGGSAWNYSQPRCSQQCTSRTELVSDRSAMVSPVPCKGDTDRKAGAVCQKPPSPSFLAASGAASTQEQLKVDKAVAEQCTKGDHEPKKKEQAEQGGVDEKGNKRDKGDILSPTPKKKKRSRQSKAPRESNEPAVAASPKRHRKRARIGKKKNIIEVPRDDIDPEVSAASVTPLASAVASPALSAMCSLSPVSEAAQTAEMAPVGEVGIRAAAVDMRRPSILKMPLKSKGWVPGLLYGVQGAATATTAQRKSSTVGFDMAHQVDISGGEREGEREEEGIEGADTAPLADSAGPSDKAVVWSSPASPTPPTTDKSRTAPRGNARRYSVATCTASPSNGATADEQSAPQRRSPFMRKLSATNSVTSAGRHGSIKDEKMTNRLSKRGASGLLTWLLLMTPTALMATAFCCVSLYILHLRNRPTLNMEVNKDVCLVATTQLNKLGPIKHGDLLLPYALTSYALFVCLSSAIGYNSGKHMLSFLSLLLLLFSVMPATRKGCCAPSQRMIVWSAMSRDLPWAVLVIHGTVQLTTSIVQSNKLLPAGFALLGSDFWSRNSLVTNQAVIGAIGSVLAETVNNELLSADLVPLVLQIAQDNDVPGAAYAVPAAVGASSNMILPIDLPMIVAHEVIEVPMVQIFIIGTIAKTVTVVVSIVSVNAYGSYLIPWTDPTSFNSTYNAGGLAFSQI